MSQILVVWSIMICGGYKKLESVTTRDEEQMMFSSWLNVAPVIEVDGEHFSVKIAKPPMYPGQDEFEHVLAAMGTAGTVVKTTQHASV